VDRVERSLRRLALNDGRALQSLVADPGMSGARGLAPKSHALVTLAALLSVGAAAVSLRCAVEQAYAAGADDDEILAVLVTIAPAVGQAQVVAVAPQLALALGYDVEDSEG
jgi:4-carboxymuconolactone decarboxylase